MPQVAIQYVGKKAIKTDNVAGTNTVWNGPGDIQMVDSKAATLLFRHPDVWAAVEMPKGARKAASASANSGEPSNSAPAPQTDPASGQQTDSGNETDNDDPQITPFNVDAADKDQLAEYAMREFGLDLDRRRNIDVLRDEVRNEIMKRLHQPQG